MEEGSNDYIFSARVESVNNFALLLKAITFSEKVNVYICETGLKFTVEEGKCVQASVFMQKSLFQEFVMREENASFQIALKRLLDCLKVFCNDGKGSESFGDVSTGVVLKFLYEKVGSPFKLTLEEHGVRTDFNLKTEDVDDLIEFVLEPVVCSIIFKAEPMKDLLTEIDNNSPEVVELVVKPRGPVCIKNNGVSGEMDISIKSDCEAVDSYECHHDIAAHYKMSVLKYILKALHLGQKMVLKMNEDGILNLSFIMSSKTDSFVEFYLLPQVQNEFSESQAQL